MTKKLEVPMETMAQVVTYLMSRPYKEVGYIMELLKSPDVKEIGNVASDTRNVGTNS